MAYILSKIDKFEEIILAEKGGPEDWCCADLQSELCCVRYGHVYYFCHRHQCTVVWFNQRTYTRQFCAYFLSVKQ